MGTCAACDEVGACLPSLTTVTMSTACDSFFVVDPSVGPVVVRLEPAGVSIFDGFHCGIGLQITTPVGQPWNLTFLSLPTGLCCDVLVVHNGTGSSFPELVRTGGWESVPLGAPIAIDSSAVWLEYDTHGTFGGSHSLTGFTAVLGVVPAFGSSCTSNDECATKMCRGGHCCSIDTPVLCASCSLEGRCTVCVPGMVLTPSGDCKWAAGGFCSFDEVSS